MHFAIYVSYTELGQLQSFFHVFDSNMDCLSSLMAAAFLCGCVCLCHSGMKENLSASKILSDIWPKVELDAEKHSAILLR